MDPFLTTCLPVEIISTVWSWNGLNRCCSQWSVQVVFLSLHVLFPLELLYLLQPSASLRVWLTSCFNQMSSFRFHLQNEDKWCNEFQVQAGNITVQICFPSDYLPCKLCSDVILPVLCLWHFCHRRQQQAARGGQLMSQRPAACSTSMLTTFTTRGSSLWKLLWLRFKYTSSNCFCFGEWFLKRTVCYFLLLGVFQSKHYQKTGFDDLVK